MRWDSSRPVPWQRLVREWLIYVGIMAALLAIFFRNSGFVGALAGLLVSGPLYLLFGFVMAKLGYQRKSLKEMKTPRAAKTEPTDDVETSTERRPPAPTKRTSGGGNRPKSKPRKR
ncbi:hypothetical protein [Ilumatobacter sp.]|uniref:hypothetical protein n=1 Tax=Ilumatobacter sp. TaxID=1967498 RepID=UPI003C6FFB3F